MYSAFIRFYCILVNIRANSGYFVVVFLLKLGFTVFLLFSGDIQINLRTFTVFSFITGHILERSREKQTHRACKYRPDISDLKMFEGCHYPKMNEDFSNEKMWYEPENKQDSHSVVRLQYLPA